MKKTNYFGLALLLLTGTSMAGDEAEMDRPSFFASQYREVSAVVTAIDHDTREVTVRTDDGEVLTFTAPDEARNLAQVKVGDTLFAEYEEVISVEVKANDGYGPGEVIVDAAERAAEGEMPGMAAVETTVITAKVEEINLEANTFKLRGPEGNIAEYVARNPENLKRAKVGDLVVMTVTEAVAITMEHGSE